MQTNGGDERNNYTVALFVAEGIRCNSLIEIPAGMGAEEACTSPLIKSFVMRLVVCSLDSTKIKTSPVISERFRVARFNVSPRLRMLASIFVLCTQLV